MMPTAGARSPGRIGWCSRGGRDESSSTTRYAGLTRPLSNCWIAAARAGGDSFTSDLVAIEVASGDETVLATGVVYATAWVSAQLLD